MKLIATLFLTFGLLTVFGQQPTPTDTSRVVKMAGSQFAASGWKELWWGKHYRKEWTTPVPFPVLNISTAFGGMKPLEKGGGHQTQTLRLLSADGKEYVLRTIDKSLNPLVPQSFKGTFVNDLVNDQISTAHPYGPLAISHLAEDIHIFHTNPCIYYVAADTALGEFSEIFANKLALLEERPSGKGWEHTPAFGDADKIVNTSHLLEKVFSKSDNQVDQQAFLKVRLFDMLVNDFDRHDDQWVWALKKGEKKNLYVPIGRDRDQAFSRTDGLGLFFLSRNEIFRPLKDFSPTIKDVKGLNFSARNLDKQFLNQLSKDDWEATITSLKIDLTDSAIDKAVAAMPKEVNKYSGAFVAKRLKQRRDDLSRSGMKYYEALSKRVTINGSAEDENFVLTLLNDNQASVTGLRAGTDTFYYRVFDKAETNEINIYGLDGNDNFVVAGTRKNPFTVRLLGGDGQNWYTASTNILKGKKPEVYDSLLTTGPAKGVFKTASHWDPQYRYVRNSVKYSWFSSLLRPGYNADDGFTLGLNLLYRKQSWGKAPFAWQQQLTVDYASSTRSLGFAYAALFKNTFGKWDFDVNASYKGPRYAFFYYGLGNETALNGNGRSYFRVKGNDLYVSPGISRTWKNNSLRFGLQYEGAKVLSNKDKFIASENSDIDPSVFTTKNFGGVTGTWNFFTNGQSSLPKNGLHLTTGFSFMNNLDDNDKRFLNINGAATLYHTFLNKLTLAHRTGAATNFGDFDFYHANALGQDHQLRGYYKSRFAGKASFYQNTELRYTAANLHGYYLRGPVGVYGFVDDGRVWIDNDQSSKLHVGYGGGIYFQLFNLPTFNVYYSKSKEASMVSLKAGFYF